MKAGFARIEITPEKQMPMAGYDRRHGLSAGSIDPLYASALLIGGESPELAVCSFDLLGVDSAFCSELGELFEKKLLMPRERILICATHTHSGPAGIFKDRVEYDREYVERLLYKGIDAIEHAALDFAVVSVSRLPVRVKGIASLRNTGRSPDAGASEMNADMLRFSRKDGNILICSFACHPTVLNEQNLFFSRDIPGAAACSMRDGERAIFLNGPCADISTRYTRRRSDAKELMRLGGLWGRAIDDAGKWIHIENGNSIKAFCSLVKLSGRIGLDSKRQSDLMACLKERIRLCKDPEEQREYFSRLAVLERGEYASRNGKDIPIGLIDLGFLILLCVSLELSWSVGEKCRAAVEKALAKPVILVCYAGGYDGYLPSAQPLSYETSYEDLASPYSHEAQDEFIRGVEKLLEFVEESC